MLRGIATALRAAIWLCATAALSLSGLGCGASPRRPNIIFVLVDDMGWVDSSVYGSQYYRTPSLERLAADGMRFTDAYASNPVCTPTRASILAGKYPERLRPADPYRRPLLYERALRPWQRMLTPLGVRSLAPGEYTIAEALRDAGYRTAFIGKWHLSESLPRNQGFEVSIAASHKGEPPSFHSPYGLPGFPDGPRGEYLTDRITDEALAYIEQNRDAPFFLALWHYAVHHPWGHKKEVTYRWAYRKDPSGRHRNRVMASMLESVDMSLGRILSKLDELGIAKDTLLVFTSDNGGNVLRSPRGVPVTSNAPLREGKGTLYEGGTRVPLVISWPGVTAPGSVSATVTSSIDLYPTFLEAAGAAPREGQLLDGTSLVPVLGGRGELEREAIFCHRAKYSSRVGAVPGTYVRSGPWKLIRFYGAGKNRTDLYELYNLDEDLGEENDLAAQMPERVATLAALIDEHLDETHALLPVPNPYYSPLSEALRRRRAARRVR